MKDNLSHKILRLEKLKEKLKESEVYNKQLEKEPFEAKSELINATKELYALEEKYFNSDPSNLAKLNNLIKTAGVSLGK